MKFGNLERVFTPESYSDNVDKINTGMTKLSLFDNFVGKSINIGSLEKNKTSQVKVDFKIVGYLVLGQTGNGVLSSSVVENGLEFKNYGPETLTDIKLFLLG